MNRILHVLIEKENGGGAVSGHWCAHVLDLDLLSRGETPQEAVSVVMGMVRSYLESGGEFPSPDDVPLRRIVPAEYWQRLWTLLAETGNWGPWSEGLGRETGPSGIAGATLIYLVHGRRVGVARMELCPNHAWTVGS